ncbi:MAG TPA: ATP-binding protein [Clostridiales bacterium]|nr:ATP-binding protein [Clostridiales bacterium]
MKQLFKELILDFQESDINAGVARHVEITPVHKKATVCMGVRRSGKSTLMLQLIKKLLNKGISKSDILFLNFFDERFHSLRSDGLNEITEAYYSLYPEKKNTATVYYFFDEIQMISGWEAFIERLLRTENCEVYLTGSSARMLSREIATQMRGRAVSWELFPFSFREYLSFKGIDAPDNLSAKSRMLVEKTFEEYLETGGFPETAGTDRTLRIKIHQEYFGAMLFRDLIERHDISHPKAVTDLAHWLSDNTASLYSVNNLTNYLKSLGHKVSKSSVSDYIQWFEDAYIFFTVRIFDASLARSNTNPKKIYCIDHSLVRSVSSGILVNSGHLLENLVFITLRRYVQNIYYYKCGSGKEVDFIITDKNGKKLLVQVCETLADPKTRKREVSALSDAMAELKLKEGIIVTFDKEETVPTETGEIRVIPAWRFLYYFKG